jgi:glycerol-3-phosphate cytidylyltransferase
MRNRKDKNVLIVGVFDLFHRGHLEFIKQAKSYGDSLFVIVNGDAFTSEYKRRPVYSEEDRKAIIESLRFVDDVIISNCADIKPYIEKYDIDVIFHGDDWEHDSYMRQICVDDDYLLKNNVRIEYTSYYPGISTSEIINKAHNLYCQGQGGETM